MKIFILLLTCLGFLDLTSATREAPNPPRGVARIQRAIPITLPEITRVFVQNTDGDVFAAQLTYRGDRLIPAWVMIAARIAHGVESVFVEMPNGDDFLAHVTKLERNIDINDAVPLQPRCFILYRVTKILVAVLRPYERYSIDSPRVPRVILRMPETLDRYIGEFERFYDRPPEWLE